MPDPFDELRDLAEKERELRLEEAREAREAEERERELERRRKDELKRNFRKSLSLYRPMVRRVLDEFGAIVWGKGFLRKHYTIEEGEKFRGVIFVNGPPRGLEIRNWKYKWKIYGEQDIHSTEYTVYAHCDESNNIIRFDIFGRELVRVGTTEGELRDALTRVFDFSCTPDDLESK